MYKNKFVITFIFIVMLFAACSENNANEENEDLLPLEVQFDVPESLNVGETLELKAVVTYGDELVIDADEVVFEVWEKGDQQNSDMITGTNNEDGTYTAEITFDHDGIFEMYAHTTAHDLHTMPKREVTVGEGGHYEAVEDDHFHTEGFDMSFNELRNISANDHVELTVNLELNDTALTDAKVRYEIWEEENPDEREWIDAKEHDAGSYTAQYAFLDKGIYSIQVHVEDDGDLHEHKIYSVEVTE